MLNGQLKPGYNLQVATSIVADASYGSEYNYSELTDHFGKQFLIPYTTYEKEQKRKYRHNPAKLDNWYYDETEDYYLDHQGVRFTRQFKVYEADEFQLNAAQTALQSNTGKRIYGQRKVDVEPVFGRLKNVFGMRRVHLRGQAKVENDLGLMLMAMNLSKYWQRGGPNSQLWRAERSKKQLKQFFSVFRLLLFCLKS